MEIKFSHLRILASRTFFQLLIVAVIGFAAYSNTFHVPFEFDDFDHIENNLMIRNMENFLLALKGHKFVSSAYQYSPARFVGYFTLAVNYYMGGTDLKGYHVVNLFIHIVNALLVYFLVVLTLRTPYFRIRNAEAGLQMPAETGHAPLHNSPLTIHDSRRFIALFSAILFVAHPVQTQAVTYTVQRFTSLATLFYLLSVSMYIKGRLIIQRRSKNDESGTGRQGSNQSRFAWVWFFLSASSGLLAMRTKEIAYTLPLVVFLYEMIFFSGSTKKKLLFLVAVVLALMIGVFAIIQSDKPLGEILSELDKVTRAETNMPRQDYLFTELRVIITYIRLLFLPINQTLDYDYPINNSLFEPPVLISLLLLSSIFGTAVYLLYKSWNAKRQANKEGLSDPYAMPYAFYRLIAFGFLWFFIALSVESSVVPIKDVISEHRVYLPSAGFLVAMTAGIYTLANRLNREKSTAFMLALITLTMLSATYARNNIWGDRVSLWENIVKRSPNLARPHTGLGAVYYRLGRMDDAMREFQTAVSLNLSDFGAHYNIGLIYWQQGRVEEAKKEFQAAIWLRPDNPNIHNNLGKAYEQLGLLNEAIGEYQAALRLNPDHFDARNGLERLTQKTSGQE